MDDLIKFLNDQLDKDEWIATGAARTSGSEWVPAALQSPFDARMDDHIARHDPARALQDVEAKRRIMAEHKQFLGHRENVPDGEPTTGCGTCDTSSDGWIEPNGYCLTLRLLALPYDTHPDYCEEWRP